jgi:hypothetical protein
MANDGSLRAKSKARAEILRKAEADLIKRATALDARLSKYVLNTLLPTLEINTDGTIKNSLANLQKINTATGLNKFVKDVVNSDLQRYYTDQFSQIEKATGGYYDEFNPKDTVKGAISARGNATTGGFMQSLFSNNMIVMSIQQTIRKGINSNQKLVDIKGILDQQIQGKEDKMGLVTSFNYQNGYDDFQAYSRTLDNEFSKALSLNYAIYQGGEIKTTRTFCEDRAGKVFNRETILSWNTETWQGMKENNDILIDLGGYNCRHDLDWISYELAKRIDPEIQKSEFD